MPQTVHVMPVNDMREHVESGDCWCQPSIERFSNGNALIVHNAMDGRELVEQHGVN